MGLPGSWLLGTVLLSTVVYRCLLEDLLAVLGDRKLGVQMLGHVVKLCLTLEGTAKLFSIGAVDLFL